MSTFHLKVGLLFAMLMGPVGMAIAGDTSYGVVVDVANKSTSTWTLTQILCAPNASADNPTVPVNLKPGAVWSTRVYTVGQYDRAAQCVFGWVSGTGKSQTFVMIQAAGGFYDFYPADPVTKMTWVVQEDGPTSLPRIGGYSLEYVPENAKRFLYFFEVNSDAAPYVPYQASPQTSPKGIAGLPTLDSATHRDYATQYILHSKRDKDLQTIETLRVNFCDPGVTLDTCNHS